MKIEYNILITIEIMYLEEVLEYLEKTTKPSSERSASLRSTVT